MKNRVLYGLLAFLIVSLLPMAFVSAENTEKTEKESKSAVSIENTNAADLQALIEQLQNQIKELQEQLAKLKSDVEEVKEELKLTKNLRKGLSDEEVKELQKFLSQFREIYPEGLITGYFGPLTEKAIKKFQEQHDIPSTGMVGPLTREKINEFLAKEEKEEKIVICHIPSGNHENKQTITVGSKSALEAHLAHGDTIGACPIELPPPPVACTTDAKLCSDGSYVSRIPPGCEFAVCPPTPTLTPTPIPTPTPTGTDLEISNLYTAHSYADQSNHIIAGFTNRGSTVIPKGFVIKFYVDGIYAGEWKESTDLLPGWGGGWGIDYTFTAGIHEIKAIIDANNIVGELSEANNILIVKVNIITPTSSLPDLQVGGLGLSHVYGSQPNSISASIKNVGLGTSGGFMTKFYVDGNYVGEAAYTGMMSPGSGSYGPTINYTFATTGNHEIKAVVDANGMVMEESEENNLLTRTAYIQ